MEKPNLLNNEIKVWQLGEHLLIQGDSTKADTLEMLNSLGLRASYLLSDIPYGVAYTESKISFGRNPKKSKDIQNDEYQSPDQYKNFCVKWLTAVKPYMAPKNVVHIFNSDRMLFSLHDAMIESGYRFAQLLIWIKNQSVIGRLDYNVQHELIIYGWLGTHNFYGSKDKSVFCYPRPQRSPYHPTTKPVGLLRQLILNSSKVNDIVLDSFIGSGSTLWACVDTHRRCVGVEIDSEYCQSIIQRFEKLTGIKAKEINCPAERRLNVFEQRNNN